jgi:tetratricopeptide (TPR) repeat protein
LALMSAQGQDWEEAAKYSSEAIAIDSADYPSCFWYNALANYHLKKTAEAEKSLAELLEKDKVHRYPQAENMYAQLLLEKGDYPAAAKHLREYLRLAPNAKDAVAAKEMLAKLDKAQPAPSH